MITRRGLLGMFLVAPFARALAPSSCSRFCTTDSGGHEHVIPLSKLHEYVGQERLEKAIADYGRAIEKLSSGLKSIPALEYRQRVVRV